MQWPPVVSSVMGPMSLPIARPPEPKHTGAVFYDPVRVRSNVIDVVKEFTATYPCTRLSFLHEIAQEGQSMLPEDSLVFIQFPTTLPLANAVATLPKSKEDVEMADADASAAPLSAEEARRSKLAVKEEKTTPSQQQESKSDDSADEASAKTAYVSWVCSVACSCQCCEWCRRD